MTITLKDFQAFVQEHMGRAIANPEQFRDRFKDVMDYAVANEALMDADANTYFNNLLDTIRGQPAPLR
jgi:hypothetical protein